MDESKKIILEKRIEKTMKALEKKDDVQAWVMQSLKARIKAIREKQV